MNSPLSLWQLESQKPPHKTSNHPPLGLRWRSSTSFILITVGVGMFVDLFLYGMVTPILPFMLQEHLGVPVKDVQNDVSGLLAAYAGSTVIFSPIAGVIADIAPLRQAIFLGGLGMMIVGTALLALGRSVAILALARAFQGMSGAVVWTIAMAISLETVGPQNLGTVVGTLFGVSSGAAFIAPILSGVLYKKTGYPGVFGLALALIGVDFIFRLLVIEKRVAQKYTTDSEHKLSKDESFVSSPSSPSSPSSTRSTLPKAPVPLKSLNFPALPDPAYILPRKTSWLQHRFPITSCLHDASLQSALLISFVQAVLLGAFDATVPLVASELYGFDSLKAGLLFLTLSVPDLLLGPVMGWLTDCYGTKLVACSGYTVLTAALALLRLARPGGAHEITMYAALLGFAGIGLSIISSPGVVEAGKVVERYYHANRGLFGGRPPYAQLYGVDSMVYSAGLMVGPLLAGQLKVSIGYGNMNAVLAGLCFVTAVVSGLFTGSRPRQNTTI